MVGDGSYSDLNVHVIIIIIIIIKKLKPSVKKIPEGGVKN